MVCTQQVSVRRKPAVHWSSAHRLCSECAAQVVQLHASYQHMNWLPSSAASKVPSKSCTQSHDQVKPCASSNAHGRTLNLSNRACSSAGASNHAGLVRRVKTSVVHMCHAQPVEQIITCSMTMDVLDTDLKDSRMKSPAMSLPFVCKYRLMYSFSASVALSFHHPTAVSLSCVPAATKAHAAT